MPGGATGSARFSARASEAPPKPSRARAQAIDQDALVRFMPAPYRRALRAGRASWKGRAGSASKKGRAEERAGRSGDSRTARTAHSCAGKDLNLHALAGTGT
jgi:hypothetical protein